MLFPTLGPSSLPIVVSRLTKDTQTEQLLYWSGMTDTQCIVQHLVQTKKVMIVAGGSYNQEPEWSWSRYLGK